MFAEKLLSYKQETYDMLSMRFSNNLARSKYIQQPNIQLSIFHLRNILSFTISPGIIILLVKTYLEYFSNQNFPAREYSSLIENFHMLNIYPENIISVTFSF